MTQDKNHQTVEEQIKGALLDNGFDAMQYPELVKELIQIAQQEAAPLLEALENILDTEVMPTAVHAADECLRIANEALAKFKERT